MGVLKTVLSVVAAGAVALIAIIAMRPDDMHVERSKVINAAPADLFPYACLLYTSPSPRDRTRSRMPSSA